MSYINVVKTGDTITSAILNNYYLPVEFDNINGIFFNSLNSSIVGHVHGIYKNGGNNILSKEYFSINNTGGSTIEQFSDFPYFLYNGLKEAGYNDKYVAFLKRIIPKPDGTKFAALYANFGLVRIYNNHDYSLVKESVIDYPRTELIKFDQNGLDLSKNYVYYINSYATDNYFYGLYIGLSKDKISELEEYDAGMAIRPEIHVWDWSGNFVSNLKTDKPINAFAVSKDDHAIYAISPFNEDSIHVYDIKELLK